MPAPPHSSGTSMPMRPSSPMASTAAFGKPRLRVPLRRMRRQLLLRKLPRHVADHDLLFAENHRINP